MRRLAMVCVALLTCGASAQAQPGVGTSVDQTRMPLWGPTGLKAVVYRQTGPAGTLRKIEIYANATDKPNEGDAAVTGTIAWAIAQFTTAMPVIELMAGSFPVSSTLTIRGLSTSIFTGGALRGAGPSTTRLLWIGNQRDPVMLIDDVQTFALEDFSIKGTASTSSCSATGCAFRDGIVSINGAGLSVVPTKLAVRNVTIDGNTTGLLHAGVLYAAPNSEGCTADQDPWWLCSGAGTLATVAGVCCTSLSSGCSAAETCDRNNGVAGGTPCAGTGGRVKCVVGINGNNDFGQFNMLRVSNGIRNADCTGSGAPAACCTGVDTGSCGAVGMLIEPDQSVEHVILQGHFTNLRAAIATKTTAGGSGGGTFFAIGGFGGSSSAFDFDIGGPTAGRAITVMLWRSEGAKGFLQTGGPTSTAWTLNLLGNTWATDGVIDSTTCTGAGVPEECCTGAGTGSCDVVLSFRQRIGFSMIGNDFNKSGTAPNIRFLVNSSGDPTTLTAHNNYLKTSNATPFAVTHAAYERWLLDGNIVSDGTTLSALRDQDTSAVIVDQTDARRRAELDLSGVPTDSVARKIKMPVYDTTLGRAFTAVPFTVITGGQTLYAPLDGSDLSGSAQDVQTRLEASTLARARMYVSVAPGVGQTATATLQVGTCGSAPADTSVTASVSGSGTLVADDLSNSAVVTAGQCGNWKIVTSGTAATAYARMQLQSY